MDTRQYEVGIVGGGPAGGGLRCRLLLLATGLVDRLPEVAERPG
jgi:hypothetical protein